MTMRYWISILSAFVFLGFTASIANAGESKAVQTMAGILTTLNHFPNDAEKQTLKQIAEDKSVSADERTVAQALMNVRHTVAAADKPKLEAIMKDEKASGSVKTLARVILNLNHAPTASDKKELQTLTS
jgi:hypothetical protein